MTRLGRIAGAGFLGRKLSVVSLVLALAGMAIGAAGCESYHYYDMDLQFGTSFNGIANAGMAQLCRVTMSGADSHEFTLDNCGLESNNANFPDVGTFEFATFADSGTLTFTVDAYNGIPANSTCLFGHGSTNLPASATITTMGKITIEAMGTGCPQPQ